MDVKLHWRQILRCWYSQSAADRMRVLFRSREKGEAQVRKIVEAGITTFVCLQVCRITALQVSDAAAVLLTSAVLDSCHKLVTSNRCLLILFMHAHQRPTQIYAFECITLLQRYMLNEDKHFV